MGIWWGLWSRLAGRHPEEADTFRFMIAALRRGRGLPDSLREAATAVEALDETRDFLSPCGRIARDLRRWAEAPGENAGVPEPWRSVLIAWTAFPDSGALASQAEALAGTLRAERRLRLAAVRPWISAWLTFFVFCALAAVIRASILAMAPDCPYLVVPGPEPWGIGGRVVSPPLPVLLALAAAVLAAGTCGSLVLTPRWLLPAPDCRLLFLTGVGLASGRGIGEVLRRCVRDGDLPRRHAAFAAQLAVAVESGDPIPAAPRGRPALSSLRTLVAVSGPEPVPPEALSQTLETITERAELRSDSWSMISITFAVFAMTLTLYPILMRVCGGPLSEVWSHGLIPALLRLPS